LQTLSRYFIHGGETDGQVTTLATTAKHLMNWVMRPLGSLLTTLPVGPDRPGVLAGPAFEIVQPSFYVLPHRQAAWWILAERLEQLAERAERLSRTAGLDGMARDIESAYRLQKSELAAFITPRALITVRKDPTFDIQGVMERWDGSAASGSRASSTPSKTSLAWNATAAAPCPEWWSGSRKASPWPRRSGGTGRSARPTSAPWSPTTIGTSSTCWPTSSARWRA
jgi:hypothetical protein